MKYFIKLKNGCSGVEASSLQTAYRQAFNTFGLGNVESVCEASEEEIEFLGLLGIDFVPAIIEIYGQNIIDVEFTVIEVN